MDLRVPNVNMVVMMMQWRKKQTDDKMYNDDAKRVPNPKMGHCKKKIKCGMKMMNPK